MTVKISQTADVQRFFEEASGQLNERGDPRTKALVRRILDDTAKLIEEMQVTPDEFWKAVDYLNRLGSRQEAGLLGAWSITWTCCSTPRTPRPASPAARRAPSKGRCTSPARR